VRTGELFLSFEGRLSRERWLGAVAFLIGIIVCGVAITQVLFWTGALTPSTRDKIRIFIWFMLVIPWLALDWKRFHDRGKSGAYALACPLAQMLYLALSLPVLASYAATAPLLKLTLTLQLSIALWYAYDLAYRQGDVDTNVYGVDPTGMGVKRSVENSVVTITPPPDDFDPLSRLRLGKATPPKVSLEQQDTLDEKS
jgi:uncharacterized membrane protein YhaH (DUF805 family)